MKATIDARYYREAGAFVTKEESRYTLSAVRLEPHPVSGVLIIATNGHTMAIFRDAEGKCDEPFNLFWREWVSMVCEDGRALVVNEDRSVDVIKATMQGGKYKEAAVARFLDLIADAPDIRFPKWQMIIPETYTASPLSFNCRYLEACSIGDVVGAPIDLFVKDGKSQAVVMAYGRDDFVGIVMPARTDRNYPSDFLDPLRLAVPKIKDTKTSAASYDRDDGPHGQAS
jgi:hypothetical protein